MGTRRLAWVTVLAAGVALPVVAQGVGPQGLGPQGLRQQGLGQQGGAGDPPARVGRVARIVGTVSFHLAGADRWDAAAVNLPVATGGAFWTEPGAQAELGVSGERLVMDAGTELDVVQLDVRTLAVALPQGRLYWHEVRLPAGEADVVQTPRGAVTLAAAGRYEVTAGDTGAPTVVTVVEGEADIAGPGLSVHVGPHQTAVLTGTGVGEPVRAAVEASGPPDAFLAAMLAAERPVRRVPAGVAVPGYVAAMTGGEALEEYGDWAEVPQYGAVWYPPAQAGFVPYRAGRWAWVRPWGWTWVDDAPWGFAPSHYGRWVQVEERWGWVPGPVGVAGYVPTYLPAVVGFLGGSGLGRQGSVGWVPLGPRDVYRPPYRASAGYVQQVNIGTVNIGTLNVGGPGGRRAPAANAAGATVVPVGAMVGSQNLAGLARGVQGPPPTVHAMPGVMPGTSTLGAPMGMRGPGRAAAPGPAMRPVLAMQRPALPLPGLRAPGQGLPGLGGPGLGGPGLGGPGLGGPGAGAPGAIGAGSIGAGVGGLGFGSPGLRAPGFGAGERPRGGAPGPALPERPGAIGALPAVVTPPPVRAEERPGAIAMPRAEVGPRGEVGQPGLRRDFGGAQPAAGPTPGVPRPAPLPRVQAPPQVQPQEQGRMERSMPAPRQAPMQAAPERREMRVVTPPQARQEPPQARQEPPQVRQEPPQFRQAAPPQFRQPPPPPRQEAPQQQRQGPPPQQRQEPARQRPGPPPQQPGPPPNHGGHGNEGRGPG